jgi:hypothetical protein
MKPSQDSLSKADTSVRPVAESGILGLIHVYAAMESIMQLFLLLVFLSRVCHNRRYMNQEIAEGHFFRYWPSVVIVFHTFNHRCFSGPPYHASMGVINAHLTPYPDRDF